MYAKICFDSFASPKFNTLRCYCTKNAQKMFERQRKWLLINCYRFGLKMDSNTENQTNEIEQEQEIQSDDDTETCASDFEYSEFMDDEDTEETTISDDENSDDIYLDIDPFYIEMDCYCSSRVKKVFLEK